MYYGQLENSQFGNDFNNWVKFFTRTFQAAQLIMDMLQLV